MSSTLPTSDQRSHGELEHFLVLIPAWNPDTRLIALVEDLAAYGFAMILVVDDGSPAGSLPIFEQMKTVPSVHLLRHERNRGKGRALKTGFRYILSELPLIDGVITADADGQHAVADIVAVARAMREVGDEVTLGVREFAKDVPLRNWFGNVLTKHVFGFVAGMKVSDTQTGLRAFRRSILPQLEILPGERYEYEMTVLAYICRHLGKLREIPITTIYMEGGKTSPFHPVWDSLRIYLALVRFYFSSPLH
ncbi:MAG TPA: glycosyltransferase family 2 protein [Acidobacteriaceae bacterium]